MSPALVRVLAVISMGLFASFLAGFLLFVQDIPDRPDAPGRQADVIVVLTGDGGRITEGARLLKAGAAPYLYISGVNAAVNKEELGARHSIPPALRDCCLFTDQRAGSTLTNAVITTRWLADNQRRLIRLVTSNYHMPRSVKEFQAQDPGLTILEHPVGQPFSLRRLLRDRAALRFLLGEYDKLVAQEARRGAGVQLR